MAFSEIELANRDIEEARDNARMLEMEEARIASATELYEETLEELSRAISDGDVWEIEARALVLLRHFKMLQEANGTRPAPYVID